MIEGLLHPSHLYREFPPALPLADYVLCLWTQSVGGGDGVYEHPVLPDGCIDIVVTNDDGPIVVGPWTKPFVAYLPSGSALVGARCYPGRAAGLLGLPASELLNQFVPLRDVWGNALNAQFARMIEQATLLERRAAMETALAQRLPNVVTVDEAVGAAIEWLARHPNGRIEQLSRWIGISSRQLQRRFSDAVGYGPKMFQSVVRFQRLLCLAKHAADPRTLVDLSTDTGYADQAHMTREVRRFSGKSPTLLLPSAHSALQMADFLAVPVSHAG